MFTTKSEFLKILKTKTIKLSRTAIVNFEMVYEIELTCLKKANCKNDNREEAISYDKHSAGVFKKDGTLVAHIPIELSRLVDYFMKENKENVVSALVVGSENVKFDLVFQQNLQLLPKN